MRSREIRLAQSLHRASTDVLIIAIYNNIILIQQERKKDVGMDVGLPC